MKPGWEEKRFEDCLEKVVYTKKVKQKDFLDKGDYPIISQEQNFINGFWNNSSDLFVLKKPIIIFGDHTKVIKYIDFNFVLGADGVKILQPIDKLFPKYFFYFLQSIKFKNLGYARHYRLLKDLFIPLPPLPEQRRIVAILDQAFAAIAKAKENIEKNIFNTKELLESYINNIFNNTGNKINHEWQIKKLGELFDITSSKRVFKSEWKNDGVPFYRAREIVKLANQGFVNNELYISEEMFREYSTKYGAPNAGDIMVTGVGTLGVCYVVRPNDRFYFKDGNIIWLRKKSEVDSTFVEYAFRSEFLRDQIDNSIGVTVGTFTIIKAKNTLIPLPPFPLPTQLVEKLNAISAEVRILEAIYKKKNADLEELKKSLLHKAFAGELTKDYT